LLTLVLFWRLRGQEKYLSLFDGHVSAEEFLEAHQDFVWGHSYFPERFLDLDHATTLTRVRMTRCSKLNRGAIFRGGALTEASGKEWAHGTDEVKSKL
jgi:hypothetical protein